MDKGAENYAAYLQGDERGLVNIVDEYRDGLIMFINGIVRDVYLAEDICIDTFFRLVSKRPAYDPSRSSFKTWLYNIARRLAYNALRHNARMKYEDGDKVSDADGYTLEEAYIRSERRAALYACLDELPADERELIWLSYFEEMSLGDIAKLTGSRKNTVSVKLFRIRQKLKKLLEERGFGNEIDN